MDTRVFCAYNLARGVFLSSKVTAVDGVNEPLKILKVLVGGLGLDTVSGLWICPLSAIPAVPRLFPFDLLYLDHDQRVVESAEIGPGVEFPAYRREVASALILARQTVESTRTSRGDRLIICDEQEMERQIAAANAADLDPVVANARSTDRMLQEVFHKNGKEQGTKNGKERRTAVSAVLTEPFPSVVARPARGHVPVATTVVDPVAVSAAVPTEDPDLAKRVPNAAGISAKVEETPVQSTISQLTEEASSVEARGVIPGEGPVVSASQSILEESASESKVVVNGQQGGIEDLFSNWVDAPSLSSAWIPRNPRPGSAPTIPAAPGVVASAPEVKNPPTIEPSSETSEALPSEPEKAVRESAAVPTETAPQIENAQGAATAAATPTTPLKAPIPTTTAIPQSPQTTTFTVANYGVWRVSMPTAVGPLGAVQPPVQTRPDAPVADRESTRVKETTTQEKPAHVTKAADSPAEASASPGASRFAGPAGLLRESVRAQGAPTGREPLEMADSKPGNAKTVLPPGAATRVHADRIAAIAHSEKATPELTDSSKTAESSVDANSEKKPVTEAADTFRERLPVNLPERAERPLASEATAPIQQEVQTSGPQAPAAKAGASAQSAAVALKSAKVESKAVAPAKVAAPKAQPKPSIERADAHGKSKAGPPSLGMRFKRWLNPVTAASSDRRRAHRRYVPGMVAHYFTGGSPTPHEVADISMTGFYLLTEDRWMPETMIQMTLQKPCAKGERKQCIVVLSKIVRRGSDGVAAQFVMPEDLDPRSHDVQPSQATDKFTLARFL
jgi:hypothetical protein